MQASDRLGGAAQRAWGRKGRFSVSYKSSTYQDEVATILRLKSKPNYSQYQYLFQTNKSFHWFTKYSASPSHLNLWQVKPEPSRKRYGFAEGTPLQGFKGSKGLKKSKQYDSSFIKRNRIQNWVNP